VRGAEDDSNDQVEEGRNSEKIAQVAVSFDSGGPVDISRTQQTDSETSSNTVSDGMIGYNGKNGKVKHKTSDSSSNSSKGKLFSFGQKKSKKGGPKTAAG